MARNCFVKAYRTGGGIMVFLLAGQKMILQVVYSKLFGKRWKLSKYKAIAEEDESFRKKEKSYTH